MNENDLQKQCTDYLDVIGCEWYHAGYRGINRRGYSVKKKGLPDLIIWGKGYHILVELKKGSKISQSQVNRFERFNNLGHNIYVIDNFNDFRELIINWSVR
jgi:hypothetical protein